MAGISDKDIIKKIRNGDIDSYSYIVKKYTTIIYQYIKKKLFKKEDVDDLVQNVFISFYKAIEKFDEKRPIKPYLFQIVQNELKMYYRSKKPTTSLHDNIYLEDDPSFVETSAGERPQDNINDYLKILKNDEKLVFKKISEGYSYEEIGKLFKKPINTIKSIVRRGRLKILARASEK